MSNQESMIIPIVAEYHFSGDEIKVVGIYFDTEVKFHVNLIRNVEFNIVNYGFCHDLSTDLAQRNILYIGDWDVFKKNSKPSLINGYNLIMPEINKRIRNRKLNRLLG